jgi:hypothetical protein
MKSLHMAGLVAALVAVTAMPARAELGVEGGIQGVILGQPSGGAFLFGVEAVERWFGFFGLGVAGYAGFQLVGQNSNLLAYGGPQAAVLIPLGGAGLELSVVAGGAFSTSTGAGGGFTPLMSPRLKLYGGDGAFMFGALASGLDPATGRAPGLAGYVFGLNLFF